MKIRNLIQIGLIGAALAVSASAQPQQQYDPRYDNGGGAPRYDQRAERGDLRRDLHRREELARRVDKDRRDVEHERRELRHSNWFNAGHESRELRRAQDRLDRDSAELRALDARIARESNRRW